MSHDLDRHAAKIQVDLGDQALARGVQQRSLIKKGMARYEKIMAEEFNFRKGDGEGISSYITNKDYDEKMAEYVDLQNVLARNAHGTRIPESAAKPGSQQ